MENKKKQKSKIDFKLILIIVFIFYIYSYGTYCYLVAGIVGFLFGANIILVGVIIGIYYIIEYEAKE